jgi:protein-disulfide isomerase
MSRAWGELLLVTAVAIAFFCTLQQTNTNPVLAIVNGRAITESELQQRQGAKLLKARDQYYLAERDALNQLIDDVLLETEARREGITTDRLLQVHVKSPVRDPTEDQLQFFYEGMHTETPYEDVRAKVLESIRERRMAKARSEYAKSLRNEASVKILLEPPTAQVAIESAPVTGPANAPVKIIEFADYECPFCQRLYPNLKRVQAEYKDQVVVAYKDFPLPMHKHAEKAAEAARCAGEQGKYWEYHDLLFGGNLGLDPAALKEYATTLSLNVAKFGGCLDSGLEAESVNKDKAEGEQLGLSATPSLFINGHFVSGVPSYEELRDIIAQQLSELPKGSQ